jgi:hypothetical protein
MSQPTQPNPLKSLQQGTMMAMATDMNNAKAVAAGMLPCFGFEITAAEEQFQVNVTELNTGHDIRLAREVAAGIQEAMRQLVEKIDGHLATQNQNNPAN